jgi:hypothetical protein
MAAAAGTAAETRHRRFAHLLDEDQLFDERDAERVSPPVIGA